MILAKKVRLYPTKEQEIQLFKSAGTARFIYNFTLEKQENNHKEGGKFISDNEIRKEITFLKKTNEDFKWLYDVSNNIAKQAVKDACNAYKRFFKGLSDKPKFKSRRKSKASFYNDNMKLKVKENNLVLIEKVGWIKTNEQLPLNVKYSNPRISYDNKYWYISVGIEQEEINENLTNKSLGIDLGIKKLAVCSDGKVYANINKTKKVKKLKKKLKRKQKRISKKYEMNKNEEGGFVKTKNIIKIEKQIQLIHRKLANIRNNYIQQTTTSIVRTKPYRIVVEDLNVTGMMKNKHISKAIAEQCFNKFITILEYKCKFRGIEFIKADKFYPSSKTCSHCGHIKKDLKLKDRTYVCSECDLAMDRDLNASINLANYKLA